MRKTFRLRRTTLLMTICAAFLIGLGLAKLKIHIPPFALVPTILLIILSARKRSIVFVLSLCTFGLLIGVLRGQMFLPNIAQYDHFNMKKVRLIVTADSDAVYDDKKQLSFDATKIQVVSPGPTTMLVGKIKVAGFGENAVYRGDRLQVDGKLFKTRGSRQASIGFARIHLVSRNTSRLDVMRRSFTAGLNNTLPEPLAPFGLGLLIGQKTTLSSEVVGWLAIVGLTHIIAVSGYNLTIIVRLVQRLMGQGSRYRTILFSSLLIISFLLLTGFSASIVRAAIVCGFGLVTWFYGRNIRPLLLLLLTAAITAGWYPVYLWSDIGWYLSFLAFFGVLILAPLLVRRFCHKKPKVLTLALIESLSAQIMTIPIILFVFERFSPIALISNVLVVPLVPVAMAFTLVAGIAGMISPVLLGIVALPAKLVLTYILGIARLLSAVPFAQVLTRISWVGMVFSYIVIILICIVLWHKAKDERDIITDENLI